MVIQFGSTEELHVYGRDDFAVFKISQLKINYFISGFVQTINYHMLKTSDTPSFNFFYVTFYVEFGPDI